MKLNGRGNPAEQIAFGFNKTKSLLLTILLILACLHVCFGQEQQNNFKVSVKVEAGDRQTRDEIESQLTRQLLSLGDVEVTDQEAYYEIRIIGLEDEKNGSRRNGYTLSTAISWRATCIAAGQRKGCYVLDDHRLFRGSADDLRGLCEQIVNFFDANSLKPLRPIARK